MSQELNERLTEIEASLSAAIARVQEDIDFLLEQTELSEEQRARLGAIKASLDAIDPLTDNPPPPPPPSE